MKLRSGRVYGIINLTPTNLPEAVAQLNNLYKLDETLMATTANADNISELLTKVNLAYDSFTFLFSDLAYGDVIQGGSATTLDFDTGYGKFKQRVQQWFDSLNSSDTQVSSSSSAHYVPPLVSTIQPHASCPSYVSGVFVSNSIGPAKSIPLVEFTHSSRQLSGDPNSKKALHVESCGNREPSAEVCLGMQSSGHVPLGSTPSFFQVIDLKRST